MIKLIALDLDGTLLPENQQVPPATVAYLKQLNQEGIHIILASGRCYAAANEIQKSLGIDGAPMILHNGAIVYMKDEPTAVLDTVSAETTEGLYRICRDNGWHIGFVFGSGEKIYCNSDDPFMLHVMRTYNRCEPCIAQTYYPIRRYCQETEPPNKIFLTSENRAHGYEIAAKLEEAFDGEILVHVAGERFIDVTPSQISKGKGLEILLARLGLTADEVLAIGDGENDISMLRIAGTPVAMENAMDSVKQYATYITAGNEQEGVRLAIEHFLSGNRVSYE